MPTPPIAIKEILQREGVGSQLELMLLTRLRRDGLPEPARQHPCIPGRKFAFDFAWPSHRLAVEVQGGVHIKGAHSTGTGIERDCLKLSLAAAVGWRVLPISAAMIRSGQAVALIRQALSVGGTDDLP